MRLKVEDSTATTWALYHLTQCPEVQRKLRNELLTVWTDNPTMEELNALQYLDMVVRESLRVTPPVPSTMRVAKQDDIIPLSKPVKDRHGNMLDSIRSPPIVLFLSISNTDLTYRITKGQTLLIPIAALNRTKSIWGDDASQFM